MISENTFSRDYTSFWRQTTPMLDGFVRRLNCGGLERDFPPITIETQPNCRGFLNEVAFSVFCSIVEDRNNGTQSRVLDRIHYAAAIVAGFPQPLREGDYTLDLSPSEIEDINHQVTRLTIRLGATDSPSDIICRPKLDGCGILNSCEGDLLKREALIEVKAGDRPIRSIDLRQILTYLALNYASKKFDIVEFGLINPRVGISVQMRVEEFCFAISGKDESALMDTIIHGMSAGEISR